MYSREDIKKMQDQLGAQQKESEEDVVEDEGHFMPGEDVSFFQMIMDGLNRLWLWIKDLFGFRKGKSDELWHWSMFRNSCNFLQYSLKPCFRYFIPLFLELAKVENTMVFFKNAVWVLLHVNLDFVTFHFYTVFCHYSNHHKIVLLQIQYLKIARHTTCFYALSIYYILGVVYPKLL